MNEAADKLRWMLWRRYALASRLLGFWASPWSYATPDCTFSPFNHLYRRSYLRSTALGRMTYVAEASRIGFADIGSFSSIGPDVLLGGLGIHPVDKLSTHPAFYSLRLQAGITFARQNSVLELPRTRIGNDVWIGAGSIVLDGIEIGDGSIIAAGTVVTKPVPPYAVVGGVPAKVIRYRFDEPTIAALLNWRWWSLNNAQLERIAARFMSQVKWTPESINEAIHEIEGAETAPLNTLKIIGGELP